MKSKYFVLGLDISTTCSGWCLLPLDSNDLNTNGSYGRIITDWREVDGVITPAENYFQRVDWLLEGLAKVVSGSGMVVACGSEQLNSMRSGETTRQLAGIQKIVQYWMRKEYAISVNEIHTTTIKKVMGEGIWKKGDGAPGKPEMVKYVNARYGLDLKFSNKRTKSHNGVTIDLHASQDDIADAIGVATTLRNEIGAQLTKELLS